jgi:hypothetical protein
MEKGIKAQVQAPRQHKKLRNNCMQKTATIFNLLFLFILCQGSAKKKESEIKLSYQQRVEQNRIAAEKIEYDKFSRFKKHSHLTIHKSIQDSIIALQEFSKRDKDGNHKIGNKLGFSKTILVLEAQCTAAHSLKFCFKTKASLQLPIAIQLEKLNIFCGNTCARTFPLQWKKILACLHTKDD